MMKTFLQIVFFLACSKAVAENLTYDAAIHAATSHPNAAQVIELGGHLRGVARYNRPPESNPYYKRIQNALLSIPGHAQYFQEAIEREQEAVKDYPTTTGPRVSYDFNRTRHFETLSHLPSPETIAVLGHFLADDKDTPKPLMTPGSDWGTNPRANSYGSAYTLTNVGLRDAPGTWKDYDADPDAQLSKTRAWWEEVKAGRKTFSFKGQSVEYCFKPDGTWETLAMVNAPDDGPKLAEEVVSPAEGKAERVAGEKPRGWVWLALPVALAAGLAIWWGARRFAKVS